MKIQTDPLASIVRTVIIEVKVRPAELPGIVKTIDHFNWWHRTNVQILVSTVRGPECEVSLEKTPILFALCELRCPAEDCENFLNFLRKVTNFDV